MAKSRGNLGVALGGACLGLCSALVLAPLPLLAEPASQPPPGDWATYGHDAGGQRHSPLDQISKANVATLTPAWTYHMKPAPAAPSPAAKDANADAQRVAEGLGGAPAFHHARFAGSETTPLVVGGRMFITTPYGRVVALDPDTGKELWAANIPGPGQPSLRGVEYWPGDAANPPRLFFGTREGRLIALDAATGAFADNFGQHGVVEMKTPDILQGSPPLYYGMTSPPKVYGNLVITGSAVQEFPPLGTSGDVRAWDARDGHLVWTFRSVPRDGDRFAGTWAKGSAAHRSGVNAWGFLTVDEKRGIVYMPFGAPSWDRYGGDRKGDNLFGTSLVAADARTGRYLWHFQVIRHDIWDGDMEAPPLLFDAVVHGHKRAAVAVISKSSLLFVLDRVTGKPIFPVAQRKVARSDTPGEFAAPTQVFPLVTPPLGRTRFTMGDVADVTSELQAGCTAWIDQNHMVPGGIYVPVGYNAPSIHFPGLLGGSNWGGGSYDPARHLMIVNTSDFGQVQQLVPSKGPLPFERGPVGGRFQLPGTRLLCQKTPWGRLSAVDVTTGRITWQVPLGITDTLPEGKQRTGRPNIGGAITTASGLTFIGASDDARFRAFDTATGRMLWETKLDASAHATPITYAGAGGRQYVAISATGGSFLDSPLTGDDIVAFALPQNVQTQPEKRP